MDLDSKSAGDGEVSGHASHTGTGSALQRETAAPATGASEPSLRSFPLPVQAGAHAMRRLLFDLRYFPTDYTCDEPDGGGRDPRDYRAACALVEAVLLDQLFHVEPLQRQGFLRALTHLLWCQADDSCVDPVDNWNPLEATKQAFAEATTGSAA